MSSTELLFAPDIESRLSESDHLEVLGKVVHDVAVPEVSGAARALLLLLLTPLTARQERLALITDKLEEKEKSYAQAPKHFTRFFLHTQWAPEVRIERAPAGQARHECAPFAVTDARVLQRRLRRLRARPTNSLPSRGC